PRRFGVVELKGRVITRIVEKPQRPKSNLAIVGIYYLADSALLFERLTQLIRSGRKEKGEYPFTWTLQELARSGVAIRPIRIERWLDCGTVAAILETNRFLLRRNCHFRPRKGCIIIPPVFIDDSARVESSIIGPNVSLGPDVTVRESIVRDAIVNSGAVLERMVVARAVVGVGHAGKMLMVQA
ncbi:MAG: sugar phosphate nucleotidyltransferase, partial [candidate division WOR-3 bacterium]